MIGINGAWGSGKSYLTSALKLHPSSRDKYIFIEIHLLSCNLNEIQEILIHELEKVLSRHGIFSRNSGKLKRLLSTHTLLQDAKDVLLEDTSEFSEILDGFRHDLTLLNKTIVIIFEDIDRIQYPETIKTLFSIAENLAGHQIKIIYQYDEENMTKVDPSLNRNYLEKYIPYTIELTDLPFSTILDYLFRQPEWEKSVLKREDFAYLHKPSPTTFYLKKVFPFYPDVTLLFHQIAIRQTEHCLKEIEATLTLQPYFQLSESRQDVITFFIMKHFSYDLYQKLTLEKSPSESLSLQDNEQHYTLWQLIHGYQTKKLSQAAVEPFFQNEENLTVLAYLALFGYQFNIQELPKKLDALLNEPVTNIRNQNINDRKDHLIWNLLCNGRSEYSNMELAVKELRDKVLSQPREFQEKAFLAFAHSSRRF